MHGDRAHFVCQLVEVLVHALLHHQCFGGLGSGDALVEAAGDLGIGFTDAAVADDQSPLEKGGDQRHKGDDDDHPKCQLGVQAEHGDHAADDVGHVPDAVEHAPAQGGADAARIAHDPGVNVAHAVGVKVGKGKSLQVLERVPLHVAAHVHFQLAGPVDARPDQQRLRDDQRRIKDSKGYDALSGISQHEYVDGILLKQRQNDVHQAVDQHAGEHDRDHAAVCFEIPRYAGNSKPGKMHAAQLLLFAHASSSSFKDICRS